MRLLNTTTYGMKDFIGSEVPAYAILSHTWGDDEVTFQDFQSSEPHHRNEFQKIARCCALAKVDGLQWVWVDTCCIDKSSSAELSEAINSMYAWYEGAHVCYVYLADIYCHDRLREESGIHHVSHFGRARWFQRGWTLQELLAPKSLYFYDVDWNEIGSKISLEDEILAATRISKYNLAHPHYASIATRMSWAAHRKTTRVEDMAYCLLGLFEVNMPLLYGEGQKAFKRLQHELVRTLDDQSIFAWKDGSLSVSGVLADSPEQYAESGDIIPITLSDRPRNPHTMTNLGFAMTVRRKIISGVPGDHVTDRQESDVFLVDLACARQSASSSSLAITLQYVAQVGIVRTDPHILKAFNELNTDWSDRRIVDTDETVYVQNKPITSKYVFKNAKLHPPLCVKLGPAARYDFLPRYRTYRIHRQVGAEHLFHRDSEYVLFEEEPFVKWGSLRLYMKTTERVLDIEFSFRETNENFDLVFRARLASNDPLPLNSPYPEVLKNFRGEGHRTVLQLDQETFIVVSLRLMSLSQAWQNGPWSAQKVCWLIYIDVKPFNPSMEWSIPDRFDYTSNEL